MSRPTVAALDRIDPLRECPILNGTAHTQYRSSVKAASEFSLAVLSFLQKKTRQEQTAWLQTVVSSSRAIFQPWSMEILYVIATMGRARFSQLAHALNLSSRTLSDKLATLREAGFVDRQIFDERPVRIEYFLTKHGRGTAALASPLFAHLGLETLRAAGRLGPTSR